MILAASSGRISPLSAASDASFRMAERRILWTKNLNLRPPTRPPGVHRGLIKAGPWFFSRAMLYRRRVIGEDTLSRTSAFNRIQSLGLSTTLISFMGCLAELKRASRSRFGKHAVPSSIRHGRSCRFHAMICQTADEERRFAPRPALFGAYRRSAPAGEQLQPNQRVRVRFWRWIDRQLKT
jgi:hypothetical protein